MDSIFANAKVEKLWLFALVTTIWITLSYAIPVLHVDHTGPVITTVGSDVKLSCSASQWTDGYTITWSKNSTGEVLTKNLHIVADPTKFSITTVTSSELESTTWTLTVKEAAQSDSGDYTCSLKTEPPQFVSVSVLVQIPLTSDLPKEVVRWDVSDCCINRNVPGHCMPLCNTMSSGIDVLGALRTSDRCRQHHDPWFRCLANERNHTPCCKRLHVPDKCLDLCLGNFSTVFREGNLDCLHFVAVIFKCFHEGRESIPSPPRSLRVALIGVDSLRVSWSPPLKHGKEVNYTVFYKAIGETDPGLRRAGGLTKAMSTNALGLIITGLVQGETYKVHVVALNSAGSSLPSDIASVDIQRPAPKPTGQNLDGDLTQYNTTMDALATLPAVDSAGSTVTSELLSLTVLTPPAMEMAQLQTTVTQVPDDLVLFDKCFGSEEFRTSCSEVLRSGAGATTRNNGRNMTVIRCRDSLPRFLSCAADEGDHRKCCARNAVPQRCLDLCTGQPSGIFDICHVFLPRILTCFREGILFLTSEPISVSAELRESQITVQWQPPETNPEMVEQYIVTVEDRKSAEPINLTVPRDTHTISIDPLPPLDSEYLIYIQAENFHGLSRRSSSVIINTGDLNTVQQQNIQQEAAVGPGAGPAVAIGVSLGCVAIVVIIVGTTYCVRRQRAVITPPTVPPTETPPEEKLPKPLNAFYIPGYFGKRGMSRQKAGSTSSMSYATSFSLRPRSSNSSEPVYSDVSGAYLWMFGNDKRMSQRKSQGSHPACSRRASSEQNIYDNNIPMRPN